MSDHFPTWTATVAKMKAARDARPDHCAVAVGCTECKEWRPVNLESLIAANGPDFSLINRRYSCQLTAECQGWNRFHYQSGVMRPLWDNKTGDRWFNDDCARQLDDAQARAKRVTTEFLRKRRWRADPAPPGLMDDVWGIATDTEREWFRQAAGAVRKWRDG